MPPASLKYKFPSFEPIKQSQPDWFPNQRALKVQQKEESESPQTSKRFITYGIPIYPHVMLIFKTLTLNRLYMVGCFFFPRFPKKAEERCEQALLVHRWSCKRGQSSELKWTAGGCKEKTTKGCIPKACQQLAGLDQEASVCAFQQKTLCQSRPEAMSDRDGQEEQNYKDCDRQKQPGSQTSPHSSRDEQRLDGIWHRDSVWAFQRQLALESFGGMQMWKKHVPPLCSQETMFFFFFTRLHLIVKNSRKWKSLPWDFLYMKGRLVI